MGFDINCGVRLLRTNLMEKDVLPIKEQLAQSMFDHIPVGVGSKGIIPMNARCVAASCKKLLLFTEFPRVQANVNLMKPDFIKFFT